MTYEDALLQAELQDELLWEEFLRMEEMTHEEEARMAEQGWDPTYEDEQ